MSTATRLVSVLAIAALPLAAAAQGYPAKVNFVDLYNWVIALDGFDDDPKRSGEKVLEAIQATWIEEAG